MCLFLFSNLYPTPCIHSCVGSSNDIHIVAAEVTLAFVLGIKTSFDFLSRKCWFDFVVYHRSTWLVQLPTLFGLVTIMVLHYQFQCQRNMVPRSNGRVLSLPM